MCSVWLMTELSLHADSLIGKSSAGPDRRSMNFSNLFLRMPNPETVLAFLHPGQAFNGTCATALGRRKLLALAQGSSWIALLMLVATYSAMQHLVKDFSSPQIEGWMQTNENICFCLSFMEKETSCRATIIPEQLCRRKCSVAKKIILLGCNPMCSYLGVNPTEFSRN